MPGRHGAVDSGVPSRLSWPPCSLWLWGNRWGRPCCPGRRELEPDVGLRAAWEAPNWFAEEVVDVDGREELRANDDWSVVSFVEEGDGLPDRLVGELEGRGGHW